MNVSGHLINVFDDFLTPEECDFFDSMNKSSVSNQDYANMLSNRILLKMSLNLECSNEIRLLKHSPLLYPTSEFVLIVFLNNNSHQNTIDFFNNHGVLDVRVIPKKGRAVLFDTNIQVCGTNDLLYICVSC